MKYLLSAAALLAATVAADKRDLCSDGSTDDNNNWYCQSVSAITYTGVGGSGSYNRVTSMDPTGQCSSSPKTYSGDLSPLDEEVSLHFRGPVSLKQFAVYTPGSTAKKPRRFTHDRRHAHANAHRHQHAAREAEPAVGDMVTATINGLVQTWVNEYSGEQSSAPPAAPAAPASLSMSIPDVPTSAPSIPSSSTAASSLTSSSAAGSTVSSTDDWARNSYYNSTGIAEGLVFLNHNGGTGSGVFDYHYGNSLSYATSDGKSGASSPETLADVTLPSSGEIVIMSDKQCSANGGDCGYFRPGTVAYHGFDGPSKAFIFEFNMPSSGETASSIYDPVDMPAIWMLNAQIPRTLQYGLAECSCWESGCGEFDIFEVLAPGDKRAKSTLHGNVAGGDSDFFDRPEGSPIVVATILYNNNIHIKILDEGFDFGLPLDADTVNEILGSTMQQTKTVSLFALSGAGKG